MLQMVSFDIALNHYGPKAVQMLLIVSLRIILDYFGPRAAKMLEVIIQVPFWISSGAQRSPHTSNGQLWYHFGFNIVYQIHPNSFESVKSNQIRRHSVRRFRGCVNTWHSFPSGRAIHSELSLIHISEPTRR